MGAKEFEDLYEAIRKHTTNEKPGDFQPASFGEYKGALSSPTALRAFFDTAPEDKKQGLLVEVDKKVTPDGVTGGVVAKALGGYDSAKRKAEIQDLLKAADVLPNRRHSVPPHYKGSKAQVKTSAGDLNVSNEALARANELDRSYMKAEANKRDADEILNAGAAYADEKQAVAEKRVPITRAAENAAFMAQMKRKKIVGATKDFDILAQVKQEDLVKDTPNQVEAEKKAARKEVVGKRNVIFREAARKIILENRKGFKDTVKAAASHTADKVAAFEEMVSTGTTGPALFSALEGVTLTPKGISRLEGRFKGRSEVLGPVYEHALRQDIERDALTPGKLKKYSQVMNLNEVTIQDVPVIAYATDQAIKNNRPHIIGQLADAGVDVNAKSDGVNAFSYAISTAKGKAVANALLYSGADPVGVDTSPIQDEKLKKTTEFLQMPTAQAKKQGTMLESIGFDAAQKAYKASVSVHNKANQSVEAKNKAALGTKDTVKATKEGTIKAAVATKEGAIKAAVATKEGAIKAAVATKEGAIKAAVATKEGAILGAKGLMGTAVAGVGTGLLAVTAPVWVATRSAAFVVRSMEDKAKSMGRGTKEYFSPTISNFKNDLKVLQNYEKVVLAKNPQAKAFFKDFDKKTNDLTEAVKKGADQKTIDGLVEGISTLASHASTSFSLNEKTSKEIQGLASGVIEKAQEAKKVYDNINHRGAINKDQLTSEIRGVHNDQLYDYTIGKIYNATVAPAVKVINKAAAKTKEAVSNIKLPKIRSDKMAKDAIIIDESGVVHQNVQAASKGKKEGKGRG